MTDLDAGRKVWHNPTIGQALTERELAVGGGQWPTKCGLNVLSLLTLR